MTYFIWTILFNALLGTFIWGQCDTETVQICSYEKNCGVTLEGYTLKDYAVVKNEGVWHVFGIKSKHNGSSSDSGNENTFMHAISTNLLDWKFQPDVIKTLADSYESDHVWAPHIIEKDGTYYMFYTMVKGGWPNSQTIGYATSTDLYNWTQHSSYSPLWIPSDFSWPSWNENSGSCRDPFVMWNEKLQKYLMYYTARGPSSRVVLGVVSSSDLISWKDEGWAIDGYSGTRWGTSELESPYVIYKNGAYYLFYNHGAPDPPLGTGDGIHWTKSEDPLKFPSISSTDSNPLFLSKRNNFELFYNENSPWEGGQWLFNTGYNMKVGKIDWQGDVPSPKTILLNYIASQEAQANIPN
jgi:glycosyl hydrolase family 43